MLAFIAVLAGCGGGHHHHPASVPRAAAAKLSPLRPCQNVRDALCATLAVPLDHSGKVPGRLRLRVASSGPANAPRGVLVFLTGGPGQPGVPFMRRIRSRVGQALRGYRLVMLDQRGTGGGALECPALQRAVGASDLAVPPPAAISGCAKALGPKRQYFTTRDTVADLDALRAALGVKQWTLDGVSYGTFVAEHYALEHPERVKALVLDSVVPQEGFEPFQLATIHAAPRVLRAACAERHCGTDPAADLAVVVRRFHDGPELLNALAILSVVEADFRAVPRALSEARAGRPARYKRLLAGIHRGESVPARVLSQGLHASTLCEDFAQPWGGPDVPIRAREEAVRRAAEKLTPADVAPFDKATATGNGELLTCEHWAPVPASVSPSRQDLPAVPTLLLAGDRDLSTPLVWARSELRHAPKGRLVIVHGAGHGPQLRSDNPAGRNAVARFLHQR
jgi:pimeloyl-ACP methyl ester carboxylesterase